MYIHIPIGLSRTLSAPLLVPLSVANGGQKMPQIKFCGVAPSPAKQQCRALDPNVSHTSFGKLCRTQKVPFCCNQQQKNYHVPRPYTEDLAQISHDLPEQETQHRWFVEPPDHHPPRAGDTALDMALIWIHSLGTVRVVVDPHHGEMCIDTWGINTTLLTTLLTIVVPAKRSAKQLK